VRRTDDLAWLSRRGIEMAVADMDFIEDPPDLSASQS